ncbi:MAG: hypothetical protein U0165_19055 [Polyangiaceae bacterium]
MLMFPTAPSVPPEQRGHASVSLRYEDVAQDGRLRLDALPPSLGEAVWRSAIRNHPAQKLVSEHGIIPILSRMTLLGTSGTIGVAQPLEADGTFELGSCLDKNGDVERIVLNMWVDVFGRSGVTYGEQPKNAGEKILVGRLFAEHVFTRLFAPPSERKVTRLPPVSVPEVPPSIYAWRPNEQLLEPIAEAIPVSKSEENYRFDVLPVVFGVTHTDSNQHVNSLIYPQQFEEAVLRRATELGLSTGAMLARGYEISYRKPSFAGESVKIALRMFRARIDGVDVLAAQGAFVEPSTTDEELIRGAFKPRCTIRMTFA